MNNSVEIDTQRDCYTVTAEEDRMEEKSGRHRFRSPISASDAIWLTNLLEELILTTSRTQERSKGQVSGFAQDNCEDILDMLIDMKVDIQQTEIRDGKG